MSKEEGRWKREDGRGEREARRKAVGSAFSLLYEVRWILFTMSSIAPNAESNTNSIEQTAFVTIKPPRPLFAVPAFAPNRAATNTQTIEQSWRRKTRFQCRAAKNFNSALWQIVRRCQFLGY
ncbi:hypothetical protein C7B67_07365 [filamentous cyanobacterium Phorm 6]|nr:hypothetical protein C7B67_07365 [filamentous cyanobacterium Phorm 6]